MTDDEFKRLWEKTRLEHKEEIKKMIREEQQAVIKETEKRHEHHK